MYLPIDLAVIEIINGIEDDDTPAEQVRYLINQPMNGYVAHTNNPSKAVSNFSQAEINRSEIIFVKSEGVIFELNFQLILSPFYERFNFSGYLIPIKTFRYC